MASKKVKKNPDIELAEFVSEFYDKPYEFVLAAFDWGKGALEGQTGPDTWQKEFLQDIGEQVRQRKFDGVHAVKPIKMAVSSGHGIGKSTISAWIATWIMCTRPFSIGSITANTSAQLQSKTFAAIRTWISRSFCAHWFDIGVERIRHKDHPSSWFCTALSSDESRSESFAGQHAANSTSWYLFDEASAIPDRIFEVAYGGITDGEPHFYCFGNATRNSGAFQRMCFGDDRHRWNVRCIDSRSSSLTNKEMIAEWIADHGEDSDFVRVRVRGLPPAAGDNQFIPSDVVRDAMRRTPQPLADEPLVVGVDISRGGEDNTVIRFRRGPDAVSIAPIRISGQESRDSMRTVAILSEVMTKDYDGRKPAAMFIDETGVGGPIGDRMRQLGHKNIIGVQFGAGAPVQHCANMRAFIWYQMREWLKKGSIGKDPQLENELIAPGYSYQLKTSALVLESKESMKKRGVGSPDDADALAVTFAAPVAPRRTESNYSRRDAQIRSIRRTSASPWMS